MNNKNLTKLVTLLKGHICGFVWDSHSKHQYVFYNKYLDYLVAAILAVGNYVLERCFNSRVATQISDHFINCKASAAELFLSIKTSFKK